MAKVVASSCQQCAEKWQQRPPCFRLDSTKLMMVRRGGTPGGVGDSCPFVPDIGLVATWCDPKHAIPSPADDNAKRLLQQMRSMRASDRATRLQMGKRQGDSVGNRDSTVFDDKMQMYQMLYRDSGEGPALLKGVKRLFGHGPLDAGQIETVNRASKQPLKIQTGGQAPKFAKPTGRYIHHSALTIDNCGVNWGELAHADTLWGAATAGGYNPGMTQLKLLMSGLSRIEEAARAGFSEPYLRAALQEIMPKDGVGVELALEIGKGIAWQVGLMVGAAALGTAAGAVIGTFFVPGLGTAAGAAAGGSLATLMLNYLLFACDVKDTGQQIIEETKGVQNACQLAVQKRTEEAKKAFAKVAAAILLIVLMAILAKFIEKGWAGIQKLRAKHKKKLEAYIDAHAERKGATKTKLHGPKGKHGYHKENLLHQVTDGESVNLRDSEFQTYKEIGKDHCIVIRVGDVGRVDHLRSGIETRGKPSWLGQKSGSGAQIMAKDPRHALFGGMLAFNKKEVGGGLQRAVNPKGKPLMFNMAQLGDKFKGQGQRPVFELPARDLTGVNLKNPSEPLVLLDHAKYKKDREHCYLVQVTGNDYIIVDALGRPFIQDVDIALIQAKSRAGDGFEPLATGNRGLLSSQQKVDKQGKPLKASPDSLTNEDAINRRIYELEKKKGNSTLYNPTEHGGNGASPLNTDGDGHVKWSPLKRDGSWDQEELVAFLPTPHGPKAFKFKGWKEFGEFCDANGLDFPYDKEKTKKLHPPQVSH